MLFGKRNFGLQAVRSRRGIVERLLRLDAGFLQLLRAVQRNLRILELDLVVGNGGLGGVSVGSCRIEGSLDIGIIQGGEELALRNAGTFVEEDSGDAAGNLGGDGGAAAGRDVAAGIQQCLAAARFGLRGGRDVHHGLLAAESIGGRDDAREDEDGDRGIDDALAHLRLAPLAIVDAQRAKVRSCRNWWSRH